MSVDKSKQRTLTVENQGELPVYVAGSQAGPYKLITKEGHVSNARDAAKQASKQQNHASRQVNTSDQQIPSWTGFNIKTRDEVPVSQVKCCDIKYAHFTAYKCTCRHFFMQGPAEQSTRAGSWEI